MKKTYLLIAVFLLLIGVRSMAMLQQARNWLNQRFSARTAAAARVVTTSGAKDNQQKRVFSSYDAYTTHNVPKEDRPITWKEWGGALSAYVAYLFGYVTPASSAINKGTQNDINGHLNKKKLGPLHKPADYDDQNDTYKTP